MSLFEELPDGYEALRIPDGELSDSYDAVPAGKRAALKSAQAVVQTVWGERKLPTELRTASSDDAYRTVVRSHAAPWAMFAIGRRTNPSMLCAALSLARFTGVLDIATVFTAPPADRACHVALDLCGVEHAFLMDEPTAMDFMRFLHTSGRGRLLLSDASADWIDTAHSIGLPCHDLRNAPRMRMSGTGLRGCAVAADLSPDFFIERTITVIEP